MMSRLIFSPKLIFRYLMLVALTAVAMKLTNGAGFAIVLPLSLIAFARKRPEDLMFYMLLIIAVVVANPKLLPKGMAFAIEQRGTMLMFGFLLTARVMGQRKSPLISPLLGVLVYLLYMCIPSALGWSAPISFMKMLLFAMVFMAYFGAANAAIMHPRENLPLVRSMVLAIAVMFVLGSVALIPFPGYGMMESKFFAAHGERMLTSFFMGMTSHSQCLGPMTSAFAVLLLADWVFGVRKFSWLYFVLLLCCPILIWKTASRGAMLTFAAGIMFVAYFFMRERRVGAQWKGKVLMNLWLVGVFGLSVIVLNPNSRQSLQRFFVKHGAKEGEKVEFKMENLTSSRMGMVDRTLLNFKQSPVIGNGFQVSREMADLKIESVRDMLSAPVEKGVWITAVLEEGGVIGFLIWTIFLISTLIKFVRMRAYITASVFFLFIVSNMGEFSFFSMSYLGGFMWALVFAAAVLDSSRAKYEYYDQVRAQERLAMLNGGFLGR